MNRAKLFYLFQGFVLFVVLFLPRVAQDPRYHLFADTTNCFNIPNFQNVASNIIFLFAGFYGAYVTQKYRRHTSYKELCFVVTFTLGLIATAAGSVYYHLLPTTQTLVWDRLPMTIGFVGFFCWLFYKTINPPYLVYLYLSLLLFGFFSIYYWNLTELAGFGDLRPYYYLQFGTIINSFILLTLFRIKDVLLEKATWSIFGFYILAKILELYDAQIYFITQELTSGHTLKHLAAGVGCVLFFYYFASSKVELIRLKK